MAVDQAPIRPKPVFSAACSESFSTGQTNAASPAGVGGAAIAPFAEIPARAATVLAAINTRFRILDLLFGTPDAPPRALSHEGARRYGPAGAAGYPEGMSTRSSREPIETVRHQLRPLFDQVVLKELDQDRMRRSGLVVPPGTDEPPPQQGIVLAVGPGLDWWEAAGVDMPVQPGDHVVFPSSAGVWVEIDEERLLVCRVGELLGVLESLESEPRDA